jgi:AmmeMemoRadiSam system protein B
MGEAMSSEDSDDSALRFRPATAAGSSYPQDEAELRSRIDELLPDTEFDERFPKVLITPHASYDQSGVIAGRAFSLLRHVSERVNRVLLLGPAPDPSIDGLVVPDVDGFSTPLGDVRLESRLMKRALALPQVSVDRAAHDAVDCLEVQLPFLQTVIGDFRFVPLLVGTAAPTEVAEVLGDLWGGPETVVVVASNLGRSVDYKGAMRLSAETSVRILDAAQDLSPDEVDGCDALNGLNVLVIPKDLAIMEVGRMHDSQIVDTKEQVVGFGAWAYYQHHFRR